MESKNHFLTGATFLAASAAAAQVLAPEVVNTYLPTPGQKALFCASFLLSTSFPDIDQKITFIRHRTFTHSIFFCALLFMAFINYPFLNGITLASLHHILMDSFSNQGVAWLWPITGYIRYDSGAAIADKHFLKFYKTDKTSENVFAILIIVLNVVFAGYFLFILFQNADFSIRLPSFFHDFFN